MRRALAAGCAVLVAFAGCASSAYQEGPVPLPAVSAMPASQIVGAVAVGADPYVEPGRLVAAFGRDLHKARLLPVQVSIENRGERRVWIRGSEIVLELPQGPQVAPASRGQEERPKPSPGPSSSPALVAVAGTTLFIVALAFPLLFVALLKDSSESWQDAFQRKMDYWRKELKDLILGKEESAHGFVYFHIPSGTAGVWETSVITGPRFPPFKVIWRWVTLFRVPGVPKFRGAASVWERANSWS